MAEVRVLYMDAVDGFPSEIDPALDTITLAGLTLGGDLAMGGNKITGLLDGTAVTDAVTFGQFDAALTGLDYKASVRVATTADSGGTFNAGGGTLAKGQIVGAPGTIDGVLLVAGDRVLVKNQTTPLQNGIYEVTASITTWDRASDCDDDLEVADGITTWVGEGTTQGDTRWTLTTNDPITVNTTGQTWVQTAGSGSNTGGNGINIAGSVVSVDLDATPGLEFNAAKLRVLVDPAGAVLRGAAGLSVSTGNGLSITANAVTVDLAATPGLEFNAGQLQAKVDPAGALQRVAAGLGIIVDGVSIQINGSNQLEVIGAGDANRLTNPFTAQVTLSLGDPVFATTTNGEVGKADASVAASARGFIGLAKTAAAATAAVDVVSDGIASGVLTGGSFTAGQAVFVGAGGGLVATRPSVSGSHVMYLGRAVNPNDLMLQPQYFGRVA